MTSRKLPPMEVTITHRVPTSAEVLAALDAIMATSPRKIPFTEQGAAMLTQALLDSGLFGVEVSIATCAEHPPEAREFDCDRCLAVIERQLVVDIPPVQYSKCPFCEQRYPDTQGHHCRAPRQELHGSWVEADEADDPPPLTDPPDPEAGEVQHLTTGKARNWGRSR